jgi:arylsulfatase A-like enzyme
MMNRIWWSACVVFLLCVLRLHAERPNIVLILSDDQAWTDYGFMGHEVVKTPHLDRLASRSLVFERGYVPAPLCRPSLASMVTGLYPHQHGVVANDVDPTRRAESDVALREQFHRHPSMIRTLVENGYLAHQSGKWWEGSYSDGGFTHGMTHGDPKKHGRHGDEGLKIGRTDLQPVLEFMDHAESEEKPFFIWYAPFLPHTPHNPPKELLAKYQSPDRPLNVAKYYAMCEWFDQTCGELLDGLEQRKLRGNTIVIYVCDNGWAAVDHTEKNPEGWWNGYAPRSKGSPYEQGIRTPIMISWPGKVAPARSKFLATSIDFFPTVMAAVGLDAPGNLSGIDLLNGEELKTRKAIFGASYAIHNQVVGDPARTLQYRWIIEGPWKLLLRHYGEDTTKYKFVHNWDRVPVQLFHLEADPMEKQNRAAGNEIRVERMTQLLDAEIPGS